jgi:peptidylprolyl isomerase
MQGREEFDAVYASALKIIENAPRESLEAAQFLVAAVPYRFSKDWYEGTGEGAEALLRIEYNEPKLSEIAGVSFYATQQYDKASKHLQDAQAKGTLDPMFAALPQTVEQLRQLWGSEAELRARDAAKDDLPRVKLVTTRGDVIIELFEDEAPNTVANFIDLVENGQYDGAPYYQVLDRQIAMAGDATGDRAGGMGFMIADEILGGKNRTMFRGSLAMAKLPDAQSQTRLTYPDTASSHFFLAYQPIIPASSEHMIFGRVIEGLEHCCSFNRIDPTAKKEEGEPEVLPDRILSAEVLRKRNHEYKPLRKSLEEMNATPPK